MRATGLSAAVVIPTWNGADVVATALRSVERSVAASAHDVAVVVVDDASTDATVAVVDEVRRSASVPITVVEHERNRGTGAARNTGVAALDADCYLFLDQDDEYLPDHVHVCLEAMQDPSLDFMRTGVVLDRPVHPHWQASIANTLAQTHCVRPFAHRLVGGFLEDPAVATVGCSDVFYSRLLHHLARGAIDDRATVRYRHHPGNAFDRQWERKFSRAPEDAESTLSGARLEAEPAAAAAFRRRVLEVERRVGRLGALRRPVNLRC